MKRTLATFGAGFLVALLVIPESRQRMRRLILGCKPFQLRYLWRDPDDRLASSEPAIREKMMDKTLADSFPASDPPSSIPNPSEGSVVA